MMSGSMASSDIRAEGGREEGGGQECKGETRVRRWFGARRVHKNIAESLSGIHRILGRMGRYS